MINSNQEKYARRRFLPYIPFNMENIYLSVP